MHDDEIPTEDATLIAADDAGETTPTPPALVDTASAGPRRMASFLQKLGKATTRPGTGRASAARGLLGEVRREDLIDAGRFEATAVDAGARRAPSEERSGRRRVAAPSGRRSERHALSEVVEVRGFLRRPYQPHVAANLSSGGLFIETAEVLEVGDSVVVSFIDPWGPSRFSLNGRVRWVTPFGGIHDPRPGMGIEFVAVDAARRARVEEMLARRLGTAATYLAPPAP